MYAHIHKSVEYALASDGYIHCTLLSFLCRRGVACDRRCGGFGLQQYCPRFVFTPNVTSPKCPLHNTHAPSSSICHHVKSIPIHRRDHEWSGKLWYASVCGLWWNGTDVGIIHTTIQMWINNDNGLHWLDISSTIKRNIKKKISPLPYSLRGAVYGATEGAAQRGPANAQVMFPDVILFCLESPSSALHDVSRCAAGPLTRTTKVFMSQWVAKIRTAQSQSHRSNPISSFLYPQSCLF